MNPTRGLKATMRRKRHTPLDVAIELGITERTVYRWLKGETVPKSRGVLLRLQDYMK